MSRIIFAVAVFIMFMVQAAQINKLEKREAARSALEQARDPLMECAMENIRRETKDRKPCG